LVIDTETIIGLERLFGTREQAFVWKKKCLVLVVDRPCGLELYDGERAKTHGNSQFSVSDIFKNITATSFVSMCRYAHAHFKQSAFTNSSLPCAGLLTPILDELFESFEIAFQSSGFGDVEKFLQNVEQNIFQS